MRFNNAEFDAGVFLDFGLKVLGKIFIAFGCYYGQGVYIVAAQPLAVLIDAEAQAPSDSLAAFAFTAHVAQGANLEDVRVIPAFAQRRVREDEFELRIETQQLLFVLHDQIIGTLSIVAIGLIIFLGFRPATLFVDREVAIVQSFNILI